jgi:hypothetical protein
MSYERSHYSLLQLIGDIGALYSSLFSIGLTIITQILRVGDYASFGLMNRIFKRLIPQQNPKLCKTAQIKFGIKDWLISLLCTCIRKRMAKRKSHYEEAVARFERELDIARLIKS